MDVNLDAGSYVVAVSGGVDSMVLLDLLSNQQGLHLIVAHFDHGIRHDSEADRKLVQEAAKSYRLQFVYDNGQLGPNASEAVARKARYDFLHNVRTKSKAKAIITAHHQDDVIETAIINMSRGTGRRGITSLQSKDNIQRPLLHIPKSELINYAQSNSISWREDSTNTDTKYLRNYIRHQILPKLTHEQKQELLTHINNVKNNNQEIEEILTSTLHLQPARNTLDRQWFIMLPHSVACEVMATWLRRHDVINMDKKLITKLVNVAKTSQANRVADIDKNHILRITDKQLKISPRKQVYY